MAEVHERIAGAHQAGRRMRWLIHGYGFDFIGRTWKKIARNTPEDVRLAKDTDRLKTCKRKNYMKSLNLGHSEVGQLKQLEKYILLPAPFNNLLLC